MTPTVGRIVHYYSGDIHSEPRGPYAALVVNDTGSIGLQIFPRNGETPWYQDRVPYSEEPKAFHWTWPPRV